MTGSIRGGFYEATTQRTSNFPIPQATSQQKQVIAKLAESCQTIAESRYQLEDTFTRRIADLCPNEREAKLSNKLKAWWELDFSEFQQEVKARFKQAIPLKERSDWEELFNDGKEQIQQFNHQLATQEATLNQAVYALFGLDAEEVMLLEHSLK